MAHYPSPQVVITALASGVQLPAPGKDTATEVDLTYEQIVSLAQQAEQK